MPTFDWSSLEKVPIGQAQDESRIGIVYFSKSAVVFAELQTFISTNDYVNATLGDAFTWKPTDKASDISR